MIQIAGTFGDLAGLRGEDLMRAIPAIRERLLDNRLAKAQVVVADKSVSKKQISNLVAIPLLPVVAAAPGEEDSDESDLFQVPARGSICNVSPPNTCHAIVAITESPITD